MRMTKTGVAIVLLLASACGGGAGSPAPDPGDDGGGDAGHDRDAAGGGWGGLRVDGVGFVEADGRAFLPRGIGIGEWLNIESYMLDLELQSDVPGLGQTRLHDRLVAAMGDADTDEFFSTWRANVVTEDDVAQWAAWGVNTGRLP